MPDSCMFAKNVCKLLQLFLIKCKRRSPEALSLSTAPHTQPRRAGGPPMPPREGLCHFVMPPPHAMNLPLRRRLASLFVTYIMTISFLMVSVISSVRETVHFIISAYVG